VNIEVANIFDEKKKYPVEEVGKILCVRKKKSQI